MKLFSIIGVIAALTTSSAVAQGAGSVTIYGGSILNGSSSHIHFGDAVFADVENSTIDRGSFGGIEALVPLNNGYLTFGGQVINIDAGDPFTAADSPPELGVAARIFDVGYGRDFEGSLPGMWSVGLRHAAFDVESDNFSAGSGPLHEFKGTGLRVAWQQQNQMQNSNFGYMVQTGVSLLKGNIDTSSRSGWICTDCNSQSSTAKGLDLKVAGTWSIGANAQLMVGYQAQYWDGVTVGISDATNVGGNEGTGSIFVHGPFFGLNMSF